MWGKCKRIFRNAKLQKKMLLIYILLSGMAGCVALVALQNSFKLTNQTVYEKSLMELEFFMQRINEELKDIEELSYNLAMDERVQRSLADMQEKAYHSSEYYYKFSPVRKIFLNGVNTQSAVISAQYLDRDQTHIILGTDVGDVIENRCGTFLIRCKKARGGYVSMEPAQDCPYQISGRDILEIENASLRYLGTILLVSDIGKIIEQEKDELYVSDSLLYVFLDSEVIYKSSHLVPEIQNLQSDQGYQMINLEGRHYFMEYLKDSKNNWLYVNCIPYDKILKKTRRMQGFMGIGFLLILLVTFFLMNEFARIITTPLKWLTDATHIAKRGAFRQANEHLQIIDNRDDEIGQLTHDFKDMLEKTEILIYENYEKQLLLQDTKYKMLQAQINPHFLYNALNTLNWLVKAGKNAEAGKMIIELGNLMHASFSKVDYVSVEEEIEIVKSYITIQQFRYKSRVQFMVETEGNLAAYQMPKMILQPLVENAIYYGVDQSLVLCRICVSAKELEKEQTMLLTVSDEGMGMTEEEIRAVKEGTIQPKGNGIGLKNIMERLSLAYDNYKFCIESEPGKGTQVRIQIPKKLK